MADDAAVPREEEEEEDKKGVAVAEEEKKESSNGADENSDDEGYATGEEDTPPSTDAIVGAVHANGGAHEGEVEEAAEAEEGEEVEEVENIESKAEVKMVIDAQGKRTSVAAPMSLPPLPPSSPMDRSPRRNPNTSSATCDEESSVSGSRQQERPPPRTQSSSSLPSRGAAGSAVGRSKSWSVQHYIRSNAKISRLVQIALLKTLFHAIRRGSVEGVRVAIERGVLVRYLDSRQRNLIMFATKYDTDARLPITVILADAGCDINHVDQMGWSCLHYACASGAQEIATELVRRGAVVDYNPYGYGPEEFVIPKVMKAKSLLQHTEQLQHEQNVKACWDYFRRQAELCGYAVKCNSRCDLGKPLKVSFRAPSGHSSLDRIRVVNMNSDIALWLQVSKNFTIPPGNVGSITLDSETLDRPSLYRVFYEKYEPTPVHLPVNSTENSLSIKNLDTGTTVSMGSVNSLVLQELESTRSRRTTKNLSNSSREAPGSATKNDTRRMSTARCRDTNDNSREHSEADSEDDDPDEIAEETITVAAVEEHPTVHSITGVYRIAAMSVVSVSTLNKAKPNEYEVTIRNTGRIGLSLEPKIDSSKRMKSLLVRRSAGQAASVNPGDSLVAIGNANIEHAGLKHTLWELNDAQRPMVLRFRRGTQKEKKSLFASVRKLARNKSAPAISV